MSRAQALKNLVPKPLRRLTRTDLAFLHFKAAIGLMLMVPLTQLGSVRSVTPPLFIAIWFGVTIVGFWVSVVGLIMSAQKYETRRRGFRIELTGLLLLLAGPVVFGSVQLGIWIDTGTDRLAAIALCYVIASAIFARMVMVYGAARSRTIIYRYRESADDDDRS